MTENRSPRDFASDFVWAYATRRSMRWARRVRFILRTLFYLRASGRWYRFLRDTPLLKAIAEREPLLVEQVHRPFFDRRLPAIARADLLIAHYRYFFSAFDTETVRSIMHDDGVTISKFEAKNGRTYEIKMLRRERFNKEGCLTIELIREQTSLLRITFAFGRDNQGELTMKIGGVQGGCENNRTMLRGATHDLYRIQPRLVLMAALRAIAVRSNVESIEGVSRKNHVYRSIRYRARKIVAAEYDQLWEMAGGSRLRGGNYRIPVSADEKPIEKRPSNKRNEYRQRATLLERIQCQVSGQLPNWKTGAQR